MPVKSNKWTKDVPLNNKTTDEFGPKRELDYAKLEKPRHPDRFPQDNPGRGSYPIQKDSYK